MRLLATFLCVFLLLIFVGTSSYMYLLWRHYWIRVGKVVAEQQLNQRRFGISRLRYHPGEMEETITTPTTEDPRRSKLSLEQLMVHVDRYETQIVSQLRKAVVDTAAAAKTGDTKNVYHVHYNKSRTSQLKISAAPGELVCSVAAELKLETFVKEDAFFRQQQLDQFFLSEQLLLSKSFYNICAVVPSSGSLKNSKLGTVIDASDYVIRFNNAPTKVYSRDVGTKTSLRIVNSQVVGKPEFGFLESPLYSECPVLVWDPSAYNATLSEWYANPDYPFFETFFSKRLMRPEEELHLAKPASLWAIWDWIQRHTKHALLPNPPSSGFLGIVIALRRCRTVRVFEFVPSMRLTKRCHYYDEEENMGCTMGDWHPLAAEKLLALAMNVAGKVQVYAEGYLTIPGMHSLDCSSS